MKFLGLVVVSCAWIAAVSPGWAQDDSADSAGNNLIRNGGFSDVRDQTPAHWETSTWNGTATFEVDHSAGHAETPAVKISSQNGGDVSWSTRVEVKRNTDYRLSAWIKTKSLQSSGGLGALMNLHELQTNGKSESLTGDNEWTEVSTEFNSGSHDSLLVNMLFGGWGHATGTVWFDDVRLTEIASAIPTMTEAEAAAFFDQKIKPILVNRCLECHGLDPAELSGGLALTSTETIVQGGESGPAIDVQDPQASLILEAINYETFEMPPDGKLADDEIQVLTTWVRMGAPWGEPLEIAGADSSASSEKKSEPEVNEETKRWWSFQPVVRPQPPDVSREDWIANDIDRFILDKLEVAGLRPAPPADKQSLIRRAYYDLIGLPPSPQEVHEFVNDPDPQAYEKLIDRLLASPHYGEKWGRHWLDLVRYAESNSFERDGTKPFVWRYRDYVIRSLNEDKPYDQFLLEQLAGDELPHPTEETIIATGYYRLGAWDDEPADPELAKYDDLDDILATTCQTVIGLTVNCARCHDHKIDPIPQSDYYRMLSFFNNIRRYGVRAEETVFDASIRSLPTEADPTEKAAFDTRVAELKSVLDPIEHRVKTDLSSVEKEEFQYPRNRVPLVEKRVGRVISADEFSKYRDTFAELAKLKRNPPGELKVLCVKEESADQPPTHVLIRGNPHVLGSEVQPGFLSVLSPDEPEISPSPSGESWGGRLAFAQWVTRKDHPLTARVLANRLWQFHFGRGIVRSSSDFGFQGTPPTHPELLDWLACELVASEWRIKPIHRLIMLSSAYRMSTEFDESAYAADPANDLFWRFDMRRLSAEELRDSILAVNQSLNSQAMFGPSFFSELSEDVLAGQSMPGDGWGTSTEDERRRRSIYIHVKRSLRDPLLANFDAADTDFTCPVRFVTTQPTQALGLLNSKFSQDQSEVFAENVRREAPADLALQVRLILQRVTQRDVTDEEILRGLEFIERVRRDENLTLEQATKYFCLMAINLNEFVYLD